METDVGQKLDFQGIFEDGDDVRPVFVYPGAIVLATIQLAR
jgi:hypothetical protein